ncbi:MAG: DUF4276 family protein [Leptolyngbyaceae bacterium]|nr:DUF4276 family protein [Leptolyngbyaceae bacterium]
MSEIRVYVEGSGDGKDSKATFRQGMNDFLRDLVHLARSQKIGWTLVACGSRDRAFRDFGNALSSHPNALNVLLVDAEAPITATSCLEHLHNCDGWEMAGIEESQCHLMVEVMENWLLADVDTLEKFYGKDFNRSAIPRTQNVEEISKSTVESALKNATRRTQKGEYHKINHGPKLLGMISVSLVKTRAPYCQTLFSTLQSFITPSSSVD